MINLSKNEVENLYPKNQLDPPPDKINTETGKKMWVIKDYKIWADDYQQALQLLNVIESF
jgi:hypothetical protein